MSGRIISSRSHLSLSSSGGGGGSATGRPAGPYYPSIPMVIPSIQYISTSTVSVLVLYSFQRIVLYVHVCLQLLFLHYCHSMNTINILCIINICVPVCVWFYVYSTYSVSVLVYICLLLVYKMKAAATYRNTFIFISLVTCTCTLYF